MASKKDPLQESKNPTMVPPPPPLSPHLLLNSIKDPSQIKLKLAPTHITNTDEFCKNESASENVSTYKNQSEKEYYENVKRPAGKIFNPKDFKENELTEIIPGRAWVFPNALTSAECEDWIERGESVGFVAPRSNVTIRTATRTYYYHDASMSAQIETRMSPNLISNIEKSEPSTKFIGVHDNWKIAKYEKGQSFPAHFDQDSYIVLPPNEDGIKVNTLFC